MGLLDVSRAEVPSSGRFRGGPVRSYKIIPSPVMAAIVDGQLLDGHPPPDKGRSLRPTLWVLGSEVHNFAITGFTSHVPRVFISVHGPSLTGGAPRRASPRGSCQVCLVGRRLVVSETPVSRNDPSLQKKFPFVVPLLREQSSRPGKIRGQESGRELGLRSLGEG